MVMDNLHQIVTGIPVLSRNSNRVIDVVSIKENVLTDLKRKLFISVCQLE